MPPYNPWKPTALNEPFKASPIGGYAGEAGVVIEYSVKLPSGQFVSADALRVTDSEGWWTQDKAEAEVVRDDLIAEVKNFAKTMGGQFDYEPKVVSRTKFILTTKPVVA